MEKKSQLFGQQLFTFIRALNNCRELALEASRPVFTIAQVKSTCNFLLNVINAYNTQG